VPTTTPTTCLESLVGLRDQCAVTDPAGLYLDQLGLTARELADYLTADHASVADLFADARIVAAATVAARVRQYLSPTFKTRSLLDSGRVGYLAADLNYDPLSAGLLGGWHLELDFPDSYLDLLLPSVTVQVDTSGPVTVGLYDLRQGLQLDAVTFDAVAGGLTTVHPHWRVSSLRQPLSLLVARDLSATRGVRSTTSTRSSCASCATSTARPWPYLAARPATLAIGGPYLDGQLVHTSSAAGLSLVSSVVCDHEGWLCGFSRLLTLPLLYATARELYDRAVRATYAERLTSRTADLERLQGLRGEFATLSDQVLQQTLGALPSPQDDNCYACDARLRSVVSLP
jgi:hypothetical protein